MMRKCYLMDKMYIVSTAFGYAVQIRGGGHY